MAETVNGAPAKRDRPPKTTKTKPLAAAAAAGLPLDVRRFSGQPGPLIVRAASTAEELRSNGEPGDLVVLSVPPGRLAATLAALAAAGADVGP